MAASIVKVPWTVKPPRGTGLAWGNPLAKGLEFFAPINERGGTPADSILRMPSVVAGGSPAWNPNGLYFNGSTDKLTFAVPDTPYIGPITVLWMGIITSVAAARCFVSKGNSGAISCPFEFQLGTDNKAYLIRRNTTYSYRASSDSFALFDSKPHSYVMVNSDATLSTLPLDFYRDGVFHSVGGTLTGGGIGVPTAGGYPLTLGINNNNTMKMLGTIGCVAVWSRALSPAEVLSVSTNPWQLLTPRQVPLFISAGAAPGVPGHLYTGHNSLIGYNAQPLGWF